MPIQIGTLNNNSFQVKATTNPNAKHRSQRDCDQKRQNKCEKKEQKIIINNHCH